MSLYFSLSRLIERISIKVQYIVDTDGWTLNLPSIMWKISNLICLQLSPDLYYRSFFVFAHIFNCPSLGPLFWGNKLSSFLPQLTLIIFPYILSMNFKNITKCSTVLKFPPCFNLINSYSFTNYYRNSEGIQWRQAGIYGRFRWALIEILYHCCEQ